MTQNSFRLWLVCLRVFCVLVLGLIVYKGIGAWELKQKTGVLQVSTQYDQNAVITITAPNKDAEIIGQGTANVRLPEGDYTLGATGSGTNTQKAVHITKQKSIKVTLNPAVPTSSTFATPTNYINFDVLVDNGLSSTQVTNLKQLFFDYRNNAKTVTIVASSVQPGPHDPNSGNPNFSLLFTGTVDNQSYNAVVTYNGFDYVQLTLKDPKTGTQLYSGSAGQSL